MFEGALNGMSSLGMCGFWDDLENQVLRGIFQGARGIALSVADDDTSGRIRSLRSNSSKLQCQRVDQDHVTVIASQRQPGFGA